jgi:hypothetical protein
LKKSTALIRRYRLRLFFSRSFFGWARHVFNDVLLVCEGSSVARRVKLGAPVDPGKEQLAARHYFQRLHAT